MEDLHRLFGLPGREDRRKALEFRSQTLARTSLALKLKEKFPELGSAYTLRNGRLVSLISSEVGAAAEAARPERKQETASS